MSCLEILDMNSDCLQSSKFEIILFMTSLLYDVKMQHKVGNRNVIELLEGICVHFGNLIEALTNFSRSVRTFGEGIVM